MDGLGTPVTDVPFVAFTPPSVVQHQTANWSAIRADNIEGVRHEAFDVVLKAASHHLLIAHERAEWYDGETFVDGLLKSRARVWNRNGFRSRGSPVLWLEEAAGLAARHGLLHRPAKFVAAIRASLC